MIKSLADARLADGLPQILRDEPWIKALSDALGVLHKQTLIFADGSQIYTAIDKTDEKVLDAIACNWKIDWYDEGYSVEQKRRIIKTAMSVRKTMGTVGAVKMQADAVYPGTAIEEWFDYDGKPGCFRIYVDITSSNKENPVDYAAFDNMERQLAMAKRWSAHMESISFMVRHKLKTKPKIDTFIHETPVCGQTRCGTWWMPSTLGWSESSRAQTAARADCYAYTPEFAGTMPVAAQVGYTAKATMSEGARCEGFIASVQQTSQNIRAGTLPKP